jgi:excisionase family DNA binding protein
MKLVITTPEMLEEIIKSSIVIAIQEFYSKKESAKARKKHYTIKESSTELKVSTLTVRNYIAKGILKAFKIGNRILITNESLENAMKEVKSLRYQR